MHRVMAPEARIEQTRRRARLRVEGLVSRITLPQAGQRLTHIRDPDGNPVNLTQPIPASDAVLGPCAGRGLPEVEIIVR